MPVVRAELLDPGRRAPSAVPAFIGLGANLGDALACLTWAVQALGGLPATSLVVASSLYRSVPQDCPPGSPDFFNAVAQLRTELCAPDLLEALLALERQAGRERPYRHAPRTLDLDLLSYGQARIDSPRLTLPHPRMLERAFVLLPLAELAPELVSAARLQAVAQQGVVRLGALSG